LTNMMKIKSLIQKWQNDSSSPVADYEVSVFLTLYDAARVEALKEMFPEKTKQQIITELLSAALDEAEEAFPYVKGEKVIAQDEFGDPMYEDTGQTSTFINLTNQYMNQIKKSSSKQ
jgi:ssRNA-specific RNase YbeY (16S rRNA maturation enzyme)